MSTVRGFGVSAAVVTVLSLMSVKGDAQAAAVFFHVDRCFAVYRLDLVEVPRLSNFDCPGGAQ
jgi:hypothetical protein